MKRLLQKLTVAPASFKAGAPRIRVIWAVLKEFAPYAAIELILPGGTVLAILCWLYGNRSAMASRPGT